MTSVENTQTKDIRTLSHSEIELVLKEWGEPRFRVQQITEWLWAKTVTTFEEMTNLSKPLRAKLEEHFTLHTIRADKTQVSSDGTIKIRFQLHDDHFIESVIIPVPREERFTVCVSTQVGCSLTCKFCATGQMGRKRNLHGYEIFDQVVLSNKLCLQHFGQKLTNIVYMGMGEPLLNYAATMHSIQKLTAAPPMGLGMSTKRITVSTAGIAKMIRKLADDDFKSNLALSLHAPTDAKRNEIMPINETNNLEALMEALEYFYDKTKNRISYEYIALDNFNVSIGDAQKLVPLCRQQFPVNLNIIEYNPVAGLNYHKTDETTLDKFAQHLADKGVTVTVRRSRGKDIDAACGQLANKD
jgi:23S rRNA (adenine2503-C2)-methyltransferase